VQDAGIWSLQPKLDFYHPFESRSLLDLQDLKLIRHRPESALAHYTQAKGMPLASSQGMRMADLAPEY
jgi:hypothetical protein